MMLVQLRELKIRTLGPFLILLTCQRFSDHTPLPSYLRLFFFPPPFVFCLQLWKIRIQAAKSLHNKWAFRDGLHVSLKETRHILSIISSDRVSSSSLGSNTQHFLRDIFFYLQLLVLLNNYVQKINAASCDDHCAPFTWCVVSTKLLKWDKISHGMQESLFFTSCRPLHSPQSSISEDPGLDNWSGCSRVA